MTNSNIALQPTQLQDSQNKIVSQVLDFSFIKGLPTENEIVLALLELDFKKRNKVEAAAKIIRRILIDQHKTQTLTGKEVGVERDGKKYIFNTYPELAEYCELKHLSRDQMGRIVRALEDTEILESIQPYAHYWGEYTPRTFRENPNNHTKAYRINIELLNEYLDLTAEPQSTNIGRRSYTNCTHECATFTHSLKESNNQSKCSIQERENNSFSLKNKNAKENKSENQETDSTALSQELNANHNEHYTNPEQPTESEQANYSEFSNEGISPIIGAWYCRDERSSFEKDFYEMAQNCVGIKNPRAYTCTVMKGIDRNEPESVDTLELWRNGAGYEELFSQFVQTPHPQQQEDSAEKTPNEKSSDNQLHRRHQRKGCTPQSNVLGEWQIKPNNADLIEQGYEVGEPYPQFLKWAVERSQRSGETRQQTKLRLLTQFDFNPTAPKELWRDYKQFLDNQYQEMQKHEEQGLPYYAPEELKLHPEVSHERAIEASVAINEKLLDEQEATQHTQQQVQGEKQSLLQSSSTHEDLTSDNQPEIPNLWDNQSSQQSEVDSSVVDVSAMEVVSDGDSLEEFNGGNDGDCVEESNELTSEEISCEESSPESSVETEKGISCGVPEFLSPASIAKVVENHRNSKLKRFKPYLNLINASLKRGDLAHKRAILEIVETLSDEDKQHVNFSLLPQEMMVKDKPENISNESQPEEISNERESKPSWLGVIAQMIKQMACTPYEEFIVDAINQALEEVGEETQWKIIKLARDALTLDALNQIEVAF